jgi:papain like protease
MGASIDTSCDLRAAFGDARHQGQRPTCIAFALSDAHSAARGITEPMSAEHLYYHAVQRSPGRHPSDGVGMDQACEALRLDGQLVEAAWPYLAALPTDLAHWMPPPGTTTVFRRETQILGAGLSEVTPLLDAGRPAVLILLIGRRFFEPIDGLISVGPDDPDIAYHAVIAVGHGHADGGEACILIRNSWGPAWALAGYSWVTTSYLQARLKQVLSMKSESTK